MEEQLTLMRSLADRLNQASEAYYNGEGELMTDYEWDATFDQLKRLEEKTGIVLSESPTQKVSADTIGGQKEAHEYPALSLAKTKKTADLVKWAEGRPVWFSWKLDGLTLVATYDNGTLTRVVTRGNGHIGTNITHMASAIQGIPSQIADKGHLVVRGEAVISYSDFDTFIMESEADYANPRNLAAGSLTLKDVDEVRRRHIQWKPFTLVHTDQEMNSWGDRMNYLEQLGFSPVERLLLPYPHIESVEEAVSIFTKKVTEKQCPFPVDGLVITYDDTEYAATGTVTGHHATRAGYAFKWEDEQAAATLDHIEWSCAANKISPVAVFSPVALEGTIVQRASLCNISECRRLDIGDKGSKLSVIKANKIIPKVVKVSEKVGCLQIPDHCPVCGAPTQIAESETGTETLHCTNPDCTAKQLKKFARFVSKEGLNIEGISEQTVARLINEGFIKELADFYHLQQHSMVIAQFDGFGRKSVHNLLDNVEKSRHTDVRHLLYALTIPLCGADVAKKLTDHYTLEELISTSRTTFLDDVFACIDGIGPEKSAKLAAWFRDDRNYGQLQRLLAELHIAETAPEEKGTKCEGLTFVVTGDVHHYKNRNELKAYIEQQGGKVTGSVSKSTSYLINNDATSQSSKNQKAQQLGIQIITEDEFIEKFA